MTDNLTFDTLLDVYAQFPPAPTIRATEACVEQFRFPRSRKRRIRNKWTKCPCNWRPIRGGYLDKIRNVLYVHPEMFAQMEEANSRE